MAIPANVFTPNVEAKAAEIVAAGSVRKYHGEWPTWRVKGTTGEYTVRWWVAKKKWTCDCPANGACCSHIRAAQLSEEQKEAEPVGAWAGLAFPEVCDTSACERFQACHGRNKNGECPKNHCRLDVEDGCPPCVTCPSSRHNQSSKVAVAPPNEKETNNMAHDEKQTAMVAARHNPAAITTYPSPDEMQSMRDFAAMLIESRLVPNGLDTPAKVILTLEAGRELGLSPMVALNCCYPINGRVTIMTNAAIALVQRSGNLAEMKITEDETSCTVVTKRRDNGSEYTSLWTQRMQAEAGLQNKQTHKQYPRAMRRARALMDNLRVNFSDVLMGMYNPEEVGAEVEVDAQGEMRVVGLVVEGEDSTPTVGTPSPPKRAPRAKKTPEAPPAEPVDPEPIEGVFDATDAPAGGTVERLEDLAEGDETEAAAPAADEEGVTDAEIVPEDQPWFQYGPTGGPANEQMKVYMVEQGLWEAEDALDLPEEDDDAGEEESAGDAGADDPLELTDEEAALCATGTAGDISKWIGEHKGDLGGMGRDALKEAAGHGDKTWAQIQKDEHREEIFTMILTVAKAKMQEAKGG
jgi:hypothetical protein